MIIILIGSAGVLTYMISNGQDPLVLLNTRASNDEGSPNTSTLENPGDGTNDPIPNGETITPTISFSSTSPTPTPAEAVNPTMTPKLTAIATPTVAELPETGGGETVTPTPVEELPVAGPSDFINPAIISGGILILLAMAL